MLTEAGDGIERGGALYRHFGKDVERHALRWFNKPVQQFGMLQQSNWTDTAQGACLVRLQDCPPAFAKPRSGKPDKLLVAREKIASDLSYMLQLPVAPVVIKEPCGTWPHHCAVSMVSLPSPRPWGERGDRSRQDMAGPLEALRVFWTWIADTDHEGNDTNLYFDEIDAGVAVMAIDHAYSLGHACHGNPLAHGPMLGYGTAHDHGSAGVRDQILDRIMKLDDGAVRSIVVRLGDILTEQEQGEILALLFTRREALPGLLAN